MGNIKIVLSITAVALLIGCATIKNRDLSHSYSGDYSLKFINECTIPHHLDFEGTMVGGLSSLDYDPTTGLIYAVSDDRSNHNRARFYTLKYSLDSENNFEVTVNGVSTIINAAGKPFESSKTDPIKSIDAESMRVFDNQLFISTEGERLFEDNFKKAVLLNSQVYIARPDGRIYDSLPVPDAFKVHRKGYGTRRNAGIEAMALDKKNRKLIVMNEFPLLQDEPNLFVKHNYLKNRVIVYNLDTKKVLHQYIYPLDNLFSKKMKSMNGVSEMCMLSDEEYITVERGYSPFWKDNKIQVFSFKTDDADDIKNSPCNMTNKMQPLKKNLIFDFSELNSRADNVEGMTLIEDEKNRKTLVMFVTDDNFSIRQQTKFFLFELIKNR